MSAYLAFELDEDASAGRKTNVWRVVAARDGALLGVVKWFGRWRQYAFFPEPSTIFNPECLDAISEFVAERTAAHRRAA